MQLVSGSTGCGSHGQATFGCGCAALGNIPQQPVGFGSPGCLANGVRHLLRNMEGEARQVPARVFRASSVAAT